MRRIPYILLILAVGVAPAAAMEAPVLAPPEQEPAAFSPAETESTCCGCECGCCPAAESPREGSPAEDEGHEHNDGCRCPDGCPNTCTQTKLIPAICADEGPRAAGGDVQWADPPAEDVFRDSAHRYRDIDPPRA